MATKTIMTPDGRKHEWPAETVDTLAQRLHLVMSNGDVSDEALSELWSFADEFENGAVCLIQLLETTLFIKENTH
jgi:hypothetical protein